MNHCVECGSELPLRQVLTERGWEYRQDPRHRNIVCPVCGAVFVATFVGYYRGPSE